MNESESIKIAIEFVSKQVDPGGGGGGTVTPAAQTGDFAIWAILAILFVGVIAYCMFRFSRVFNGEFVTAAASPKHARNAHRGGRFATTKAVLIAAIVGLIACLSITTTTAIASNANNGIVTIPDKIQIAIDEETGQPDPVSFQFFNDSTDYTYFTQSSVLLSSEAQSVSSPEVWNLTLNTLGTCIFTGAPSGAEYTINDTKVFEPFQKSDSSLSFGLFDHEATKALIGKKAFEVTLTCSTDVAFTPEAITGLTYNESEQTGVLEGANYSISGNKQTIPGNYTATVTLTDPTNFVWKDGTKADKQISWSIGEAPVNVPVAKTGLVYEESKKQTGVEDGDGYSVTDNRATNAGNYTAKATLDQYYVWSDGSHNVKEIPWSIAKAEGGFSDDPEPSSELVYSTEKQKLIKPGTVDYEANVYYMIEGQTSYATDIPEATDARSYNIKAYIGESRNYEATEPITLTATIEKAVVSSVTIQGSIGDADYIKDASYVFPDFDHGEEAYTITSWEVEKGPKNVFKKEQVRPLPNDAEAYPGKVTIGKATPEDIGTHDFILPDKKDWSYLDANVEVKQDAWNPIKGCFTLNEESIVSLEVSITSSKTEYLLINETIEYSVNITNKTEEAISGAKLTFGGQDYSVDTIPAKGNQVVKIDYKIVADDFLYYPNLVKKFIFKYNDFSKQVQHQTSLKNKTIVEPTLYNGFYDKTEHKFPANDGYTFLGGYDTSFNAGDYYAVVMRNLGYEWANWPYDYNVYTWEIKKINVNICFVTPEDKNTFTVTYGDNWNVEDQSIVAKTTDVATLPDSLHDILDGDPYGHTSYEQWSNVDTKPYAVEIIMPSPTNSWNNNYNIIKTDASLYVVEKDITISWPTEKVFKYTGDVIDIKFTINGSFSEHPATVSYTTYADQARTTPKPFKDTGSYYVSAHLGTDADSVNYKITEGAQPSEAFEIKNELASWPKALLIGDYELLFLYDDITYKPDEYVILKVYDITNTSYSGDGSENIYPQWYQDAVNIKKVTITPSFVNCNKCSDGTTALTSMDSWFAYMQNLEKIEGLENIHAGITTLNATFMNTRLDDYTFPKGFFNGITSTHSMFKNCSSIEEIGVLDWTNTSFTNTTSMFEGCSSLKHIYCSKETNWNVSSLTSSDNMFNGCISLHNYSDSTPTDITYARVDKDDLPGYFEYPSHENLYEYTLGELKVVSDYLAKYYTDGSQDPVCLKFIKFRESGLKSDGGDNGVAMKANLTSHWAIDKNGKLFGEAGFINDNTTIQARIIGICEDYVDKEQTQKIGLTFMTTHALNTSSSLQAYHDKDATYGWGGDSAKGSCALRTKLNDGSLFPKSLIDSVKKAAKGFQYSSDAGSESNTAIDKFWAPSMLEMYGESSSHMWPEYNEGKQYKIFEAKGITDSSYAPFSNLDIPQKGVTRDRTSFVWSRSLIRGRAIHACGVFGGDGGNPVYDDVDRGDGVVACFCI